MSGLKKIIALTTVGISLGFVLIVSTRSTPVMNNIINRVLGEVSGAASADGSNGGSW